MKELVLAVLAGIFIGTSVVAASDTPYAGQETRGIKTLSDREIEGYLNGSGMGYAKAAELNHFPGPRHVLDLGTELGLTGEQAKRTRAIFDAMKQEASRLGARLVELERELDRKFASGSMDEDTLNELVSEIGALEASIRKVHLKAHLDQKDVLNEHQIVLYGELRGYATARERDHDHAH